MMEKTFRITFFSESPEKHLKQSLLHLFKNYSQWRAKRAFYQSGLAQKTLEPQTGYGYRQQEGRFAAQCLLAFGQNESDAGQTKAHG